MCGLHRDNRNHPCHLPQYLVLVCFVSNGILLQFSPQRGWTPPPNTPPGCLVQGTPCSSPRALLWSQCNAFEAVTVCSSEAQGGGEFPVCWLPSPTAGRIPAGTCTRGKSLLFLLLPSFSTGAGWLASRQGVLGNTGSHDGSRDSPPPKGGTVSWGEW